VWSTAPDTGAFVFISRAAEEVFGRPVEALLNDNRLWFDAVHPDDRQAVEQSWQLLTPATPVTRQYRITQPDGTIRWLEDRLHVVVDEHGQLLRIDGIANDITARKQQEDRYTFLATHDALTTLPNRSLFNDRARQSMTHVRRYGGILALAMLDLDRFKIVNDSFGHSFGDMLLCQVANRLQRVLREGDTIARQGGDEFALIVADLLTTADAATVCQKIIHALAEPFLIEDRELFVTSSMGVSIFPTDGEDLGELLKQADAAMYRSKGEGGNNFHFYSRELGVEAMQRLELEHALRPALERGEFEIYYQPRVCLRSARIVGVEALIRWRRDGDRLVQPAEFLEVAEETGIIAAIDRWVLQTACRQLSQWRRTHQPDLTVSINLSERQIRTPQLVDELAATLAENHLAPAAIELDFTETVVMRDMEHMPATIALLKELGVGLAIDDFGTGWSSFDHLKRLRATTLKIDKSFVLDIQHNTEDAAIVKAIIALGHTLKMRVVAEGVETPQQLEFLNAEGCDEVQGYLFSEPLPAVEVERLLATATLPWPPGLLPIAG
jgi:diguanylate cyclase (GGDEF)-like protein/PAS domain S-box-containing protein